MSQDDPTLAALGIDGETAELLEANGLLSRSALENFGDLTPIIGIGPVRATVVADKILASYSRPPAEPAAEPVEAVEPAELAEPVAEPVEPADVIPEPIEAPEPVAEPVEAIEPAEPVAEPVEPADVIAEPMEAAEPVADAIEPSALPDSEAQPVATGDGTLVPDWEPSGEATYLESAEGADVDAEPLEAAQPIAVKLLARERIAIISSNLVSTLDQIEGAIGNLKVQAEMDSKGLDSQRLIVTLKRRAYVDGEPRLPGTPLGMVTLMPGVTLNYLVDAVRNDLAGGAPAPVEL